MNITIIGAISGLVLGAGAGYLVIFLLLRSRMKRAEQKAEKIIQQAEKQAEAKLKEAEYVLI